MIFVTNKDDIKVLFENTSREERGKLVLELMRKRGAKTIELPVDENGHAFIDKEKYPDLYERWSGD